LIALPLFYFFWVANLFMPTATPVQTVLNALGKARLSMAIATMWMLLTWGIGFPLALSRGLIGLAIATVLVQVSNLVLYRIVQRHLPFRIFSVMLMPWVLASTAGAALWLATRTHTPRTLPWLTFAGFSALALYVLLLAGLQRDRIVNLRRLAGGL
jgi:O-antigen/teichoic acid export membrane protein